MAPVRVALLALTAALALVGARAGEPAQAAPERLPSSPAAAPEWRLVLEGGVTRARQFDNRASEAGERVASSARDTYRATVTVAFSVGPDGAVTGYGSGRYTVAEWHLEGVNGSRGRFACEPPVTAPPFGVTVSGRGTPGRVVLELALQAGESNENTPCGAAYTAYATRTTYLAESWAAVGGNRLAFDVDAPAIPPLRRNERSSTATTTQTARHEWRATLRRLPPPAAPPVGSQPVVRPVRKPGLPDGIGLVPTRAECTVLGTPEDDVLTGTVGRDVICGLGGNDTIASFAGDDVIAGGSGADLIAPGPGRDRVFAGPGADRVGGRDGRRDLVNGGPGSDLVWVDPGLDEAAFVESVF